MYSSEAKNDLEDIAYFIWSLNYIKLIASIENSTSLLMINPEMWVEIVKWEREIIESKYKYQIRYIIMWKEIFILAIYKFKNIKWR